jgi:pyruvate/2-oxoglutarate dehydrogenase complex dihydrolipoamide acyltransferase (E2) component
MSPHVFKLPDLGEGTVSAEVVAWHAKPGDIIKEDQPLVEMSTDKAVVEIPSPVSGRVLTINGKPGDVIPVGTELATFQRRRHRPRRRRHRPRLRLRQRPSRCRCAPRRPPAAGRARRD